MFVGNSKTEQKNNEQQKKLKKLDKPMPTFVVQVF